MTEHTDPKRSVELLSRLRAYGYSDDEFTRLHHFDPDNYQTIQSHIDYCRKIRQFQPGSSNAILQAKLEQELVLLLSD